MSEVTVIMPVYNGLPHVRRAIEAVLNQTVRTGWELLIIDDASQDESWNVISAYADDSRRANDAVPVTAVRHNTNLGLYPTLNRWIPSLTSSYVAIAMQDDELQPQYLQEMLQLAHSYPDADAIWSTHYTIDDRGHRLAPRLAKPVHISLGDGRHIELGSTNSDSDTGMLHIIPAGTGAWLGALDSFCFWLIPNSFTRVKLFTHLPFREDLRHVGDWEWLCRAVRTSQFLFYERPLSSIRSHAGQATARHMAAGIDVEETFRVLAEQFIQWPSECPKRLRWPIASQYATRTFRRSLAAASRGRLPFAWWLARKAVNFAALPLSSTPPPVPPDLNPGLP